MRVFIDDLELRAGRRHAVRNRRQPHDKQNHHGGEAAVATLWLAFYLLALVAALVSPALSDAINLAARY
jgi:hypothetical protein